MATDTSQSDVGGENNIQVFIRIRPPCADEPGYSRVVDTDPSNKQVILQHDPNPRIFSFDHVADTDSKQEVIFSKLGKKVIENCMAGYNGTIFAYGQTGSGKTFTMMGPSEDSDNFRHELRGVIPRSFEYLFNLIAREKELHGDNKQFLCKCSFLEIYKEQIFDLLEPSTVPLHLRESLDTGVYVAGLSEQVVVNATEAYEVLNSSWVNRKVASTSMNRESSRSHAVFTLQMEIKENKGGLDSLKTSCLNLVDLAGSERQKDTGASGIRLKEAGSINRSLSNLGNVIMALVSVSRDGNKKRFIPYRDSKLTFLLRDSLGGNSKTSLIACVHPGHKCYGETLSTLLFAKRAKMIKNKAVLNENASGNIKQLQAKIKKLTEELQQCKMGIPQQPSIAPAENMPVAREMFIQAMCLRQKSEREKQELHETLEKLRDVCEKKDRAIQTNKMIIKFRDNNIKRLEEKLKGAEVQDTQQENLLKEIDALRVQVEHHPLVAKHALDVQRLKSAIRSLKEDSGILQSIHKDTEKVRSLEEEFHRLVTEQQGSKDEQQITPQRSDTVSTATVEKLRSQVADFESRIEQLTSELSESKQSAEKDAMYKDGEIASYKRTVEELKNVMEANNIRSKLEKAALNEQHLHTVMTITTPKKESYKLRSRTVLTSSDTPDLDSTIPFEHEKSPVTEALPEEEGILQEDVPEDFAQQAHEALLDQIKQLQEKNTSLEARLGEYETDRVKQLHDMSVMESQIHSMEELLGKEQQAASSLREQYNKVEPKLRAAVEDKDNAVGETRDLRLLLAQADKDLKEYKEKVKVLEVDKREQIDLIESKMADLSQALEHVTKDNEKLLEKTEVLELDLEREVGEREFLEGQAQKFELEVLEQQENIKKLKQDILDAEKTILDERDHRECLVNQLCRESTEKDKELVQQFEENKNLMVEYTSLKIMIEGHEDSARKLRKAIEDKESKIINLEKSLKGTKEKVAQYYSRLEEQSSIITELTHKLDTATEQSNFYREKEETLSKNVEELNSNLASKVEELETQKCKHTFDVEMLNEDLKSFQDDIDELKEEYTRSQEQLQKSEEHCHTLSEEVNTLKLTLKEREETIQDKSSIELAVLTEKLKDMERLSLERMEENTQLKHRNEEITDKFQSALMDLESKTSECQFAFERSESQGEQITELHTRCHAAETRASNVESDRNQAQARITELESRLQESETDQNETKKYNEDLKETERRLMAIAEKDNDIKMSQKSELDEMKSKMKKVCQLFEVSETECNEFEVDDLIHNIDTMKKENKQLLQQNNELIGHNNLRQKIKFHERVKDENIGLRKEQVALQDKNRHLQDEIKSLKQQLKMSEFQLKDKTAGALKENKIPQHKTFFSGDFSQRSPNLSDGHKNGNK